MPFSVEPRLAGSPRERKEGLAMRRTSWAVWVAVAILASSLAGLMPEAAWANHIAQCPGPTGDFDVCFYADINWTGAEEVFTGTGLFNLNAALNDQASSLINNRAAKDIRVYTGTNGSGSSLCVDSDRGLPDLSVQGFNNVISRVRIYTNDTQC